MRPWSLALATLALSACRMGPPTIGDPPPRLEDGAEESAYQEVLDRHTGTGEIYAGFDTELFAGATFQTWAFREARVRRLARFKQMTAQEIDARLAEERADWEKAIVFHLGTWVRDPKFDDFDRKDSIWRIALVAEGVEILPVDVSRVARVDQNVRAVYPYMGMFWVQYRVEFPRARPDGSPAIAPGTKDVTLRLASTLGRADLRAGAE